MRKKRIFVLLLSMCLMAGIAGCSQQENSSIASSAGVVRDSTDSQQNAAAGAGGSGEGGQQGDGGETGSNGENEPDESSIAAESTASSDSNDHEGNVDNTEDDEASSSGRTENSAGSENDSSAVSYTYGIEAEPQYDGAWSDDDAQQLVSVTYSYLHIAPEYDEYGRQVIGTGEKGIQKALSSINPDTDRISGNFVSENKDNAQTQYDELEDKSYFGTYTDEDNLTVVRADSRVFSVLRNDYQYLGGAHGFNASSAYNFDPDSGSKLSWTDVLNVKDTAELAKILADEVPKQNDPDALDLFEEDATLESTIQDLLDGDEYYTGDNDLHYVTWYVDNGGVNFIFDQYLLGSYAAGRFTVHLSAADYPDIVRPEYAYGPEEYFQQINPYVLYDVDEKDLSYQYDIDQNSDLANITVEYGETSILVTSWAVGAEAYLVTVPSGKFLYINVSEENDWETVYVVDFESDDPKAESMDAGFGNFIPTDPENVMMSTRTQLMSTAGILRTCHVEGGTGKLVPNSDYFTVEQYDGMPVLSLKQDAELDVLNSLEDTNPHTETIKKGTKFRMVRTDNESIVDCVTDEGTILRFHVDGSVYPEKIDGKYDLEDLIDGTAFAG